MLRSSVRSRRVAYGEGAWRVDTNYIDVHVRRARAALAPEDAVGWTPRWALAAGRRGGRAWNRLREHRRRAGSRPVRGHRPRARHAVGDVRVAQGLLGCLRPRPDAVDDRRLPDARLGEQVFGEPDLARLWDAVRATVRLDEPDAPAAWASHVDDAPGARRAAERAAVRRRPFPRAGHGLDRGALAAVALDGREHGDVVGAVATSRTCRPRRSSRPGPPADRGARARNAAARPDRRHRRQRPRDDLRKRSDHGGRRGDGCRRGAGGGRPRRRGRAARRGRARRRALPRRQERDHVLEHAVRRERRVAHRVRDGGHASAGSRRAARRRGPGGAGREPLTRPHRLHGRRARGRGRRDRTGRRRVPILRDNAWQL